MNLRLVAFVSGLIADSSAVKRVSTPVMGAAIVLGLLTSAMRLRQPEAERAPAIAS
jgi:hypothetical protein